MPLGRIFIFYFFFCAVAFFFSLGDNLALGYEIDLGDDLDLDLDLSWHLDITNMNLNLDDSFNLAKMLDSDEDSVLVAASQEAEKQYNAQEYGTFQMDFSDISDVELDTDVAKRFVTPVSDDKMKEMYTKDVPKSTSKSVQWATNLFESWRKNRNIRIMHDEQGYQHLSLISRKLENLNIDELNYSISRFLYEVRRADGLEFPPRPVRQLVLLLQMHLASFGKEVRLLSDTQFRELQNSVDHLMKDRDDRGLGLKVKQAQVIRFDKEDILWSKGLLGRTCPRVLLDTLVYLIGLNFALRSGEEHRLLSHDQLEICSDDSGVFLKYTEKISKNNRRGLKDFRVKRKVCKAYERVEDRERCLVDIYRLYMSLCPSDVEPDSPLYLQPLKKPTEDRWFSLVPVGKNPLAKTVTRLCKAAGFEGKLFCFCYFCSMVLFCILKIFSSDSLCQSICLSQK